MPKGSKKVKKAAPLINWNGSKKTVLNPAQGVFLNKLYFGIPVPTMTTVEIEENGQLNSFVEEGTELALIFENNNFMLKSQIEEANCAATFSHEPIFLAPRWSFERIKLWRENHQTNPTSLELLEELKNTYQKYIDFRNKEDYYIVSAWVMGTYLHQLFAAYPYLFLNGMKESGKTKTLTVTQQLAFNSISSGNLSTSAMFRLIQDCSPTLLLDETEALKDPERAEEIRSLLLSGYKKGFHVYRANKDKKNTPVESFEIYSPKMIANIQGLEQVLESRTIPIMMVKTLRKDIGSTEIEHENPDWEQLREKLYRWAYTNWNDVRSIYQNLKLPDGIENRTRELWQPVLSVIKDADEFIYDEISTYAVAKSKERIIEQEIANEMDVMLLKALALLLTNKELERLHVKTITQQVRTLFTEPPSWLKSRWVSTRMKVYGFEKDRDKEGICYLVGEADLDDCLKRFGLTKDYLLATDNQTIEISKENQEPQHTL